MNIQIHKIYIQIMTNNLIGSCKIIEKKTYWSFLLMFNKVARGCPWAEALTPEGGKA
jgi:hypothetical protein